MKHAILLSFFIVVVCLFTFAEDEYREGDSVVIDPVENSVFYMGVGGGKVGTKLHGFGEHSMGRSHMMQADYSAYGIYLTPTYPIENFPLYALLEYVAVDLDARSSSDTYSQSFHWGIGTSHTFEERMIVFTDYVKLSEDESFDLKAKIGDTEADRWNIGVSYIF